MTQKELDALLAEWLETLRLRDWEVKARFGDAKALDGALATCSHTSARKIATILILDPREPTPERGRKRDVESDLVHEVIHLHLAPIQPENMDSAAGIFLEQAIDLISLALVGLKRQKRGKG